MNTVPGTVPDAPIAGACLNGDSGASATITASGKLPRLLKRAEFLAAAASGRRVHSSRMTVQVMQRAVATKGSDVSSNKASGRATEEIRGPRFGLTVTKKTANAVGRNRIRRRLRGLLSRLKPFWPQADIDFVIIGRAEMLTAKADVIEADLKRAFSSPPRQGNPRVRQDRAPKRGRGGGDARSRNATQQDPTGGS